jgi:hypothetical protein
MKNGALYLFMYMNIYKYTNSYLIFLEEINLAAHGNVLPNPI